MEKMMTYEHQNPDTYGMYPVTYTASPAELARWDEQGADHGIDYDTRVHLEMVHHALNTPNTAPGPRQPVNETVMRLTGVTVEV